MSGQPEMNTEKLQQSIDLEILKTEKRRLDIFIGVMVFNLLMVLFNLVFFPSVLYETFKDLQSMFFLLYVTLAFVVLLGLSRVVISKLVNFEKSLPLGYKIYSIAMESLMPFVPLVFIISYEGKAIFLDSPLVLLVSLLIIVSALHLNFWVSLLSGLIAGVAYGVIAYWTFENFDSTHMVSVVAYYSKAVLFVLAGAVAGLVAHELRKRLAISISTQNERDQIEELFSQQVSSQVVAALKSEEDFSVKAEATVLFLDIRKFTQRVQHFSPEEVDKFQNKFFGPIIECINRNDGFINQLMGDGLMATFASTTDGHQERAFTTAHEILKDMQIMNEGKTDQIKVGIGIHSGEIVAGNIGTKERQQFSISGVPVILAARLEQLTKEYDSSLLVTNEFYQRVKHLNGEGESLGLVKIKGLDQEIELIKVC